MIQTIFVIYLIENRVGVEVQFSSNCGDLEKILFRERFNITVGALCMVKYKSTSKY